jgi:NADP-dependent 3-hydroxy acid dehydrogenase YdfG
MQIPAKSRVVPKVLQKTMSNPVWLITGCSSGLGHTLGSAVLHRGHRVVLTARNTAPMQALADAFPGTALVCALDVTKPEQIANVVRRAESHFGHIRHWRKHDFKNIPL